MNEFSQAKFESKAKKLVTSYYKYNAYKANEKDVSIVWFSKSGSKAKALLSSKVDDCYYEVTYLGEECKYIVYVYDIVDCKVHVEEGYDG